MEGFISVVMILTLHTRNLDKTQLSEPGNESETSTAAVCIQMSGWRSKAALEIRKRTETGQSVSLYSKSGKGKGGPQRCALCQHRGQGRVTTPRPGSAEEGSEYQELSRPGIVPSPRSLCAHHCFC